MHRLALAAVGFLVLGADLFGDWDFFFTSERREFAFMLAALVRNSVTVLAIVALFRRDRFAGYFLIIAALLGLWRRGAYLLPLVGVPDWTLYTAGVDTAFRILLLGFGIGYLAGRDKPGESHGEP